MPARTAASASARAGAPPTVMSSVDARPPRPRRTSSCSAADCVAELEHLAEHRDAPRASRARQHVERAPRRGRVRVVAVVDHRDAARQPQHLAPMRGGLEPRRPVGNRVERHAELERDRGRGQHVRQVAAADERSRELALAAAGVATRATLPSTPRSSTRPRGRRPAATIPNVTTRPGNAATRATIAVVVRIGDEQRVVRRRPRESPPSRRRWPRPTRRSRDGPRRRWSTHARRARRSRRASRISPAWFIPSSTTAISGRRRRSMSDSGRPMWLFKFPRLRTTRYRNSSNSAVTSFVVVLPALPVMATTTCARCPAHRSRQRLQRARRVGGLDHGARARGLRRRGPPAARSPAAPASIAAPAKSAPSNRSPRIATNSAPGASVRVSIETPVERHARPARDNPSPPPRRPPTPR